MTELNFWNRSWTSILRKILRIYRTRLEQPGCPRVWCWPTATSSPTFARWSMGRSWSSCNLPQVRNILYYSRQFIVLFNQKPFFVAIASFWPFWPVFTNSKIIFVLKFFFRWFPAGNNLCLAHVPCLRLEHHQLAVPALRWKVSLPARIRAKIIYWCAWGIQGMRKLKMVKSLAIQWCFRACARLNQARSGRY